MAEAIRVIFEIYTFVLIFRVFMSWLPIPPENPFIRFVVSSTDPLLKPISRLVPPLGGMIDLSPIIALMILRVVQEMLVRLIGTS